MATRQTAKVASAVFAALLAWACGGSTPPADLTTPAGSVNAAFESAKAGGLLKEMDFFGCVYSGGGTGSTFSGFLSGLNRDAIAASGVDPDEFLGAFKASFADYSATEASRTDARAVVHLKVSITLDVDRGKLRDILKRYAEKQGLHIDDATLDAGIQQRVGTLPATQVLEHDVTAVQQGGQWHVCDSVSAAGGTGARTAAPTATLAGPATAVPTPSTAPSVPSVAPTVTASQAVAGWQPFVSAKGGYTVEMPGPASSDSSTVGFSDVLEAGWIDPGQTEAFLVGHKDLSPTDASNTAAVLQSTQDSLASQLHSTVSSSEEITLAGLPGRRFVATSPQAHLTVVVLLGGVRVYILIGGGPNPPQADIDRFVASFTVTSPAPLAAAPSAAASASSGP